ncbi:MAG: C25 family cysteine peptidase [Methanobacteriota archaeon]
MKTNTILRIRQGFILFLIGVMITSTTPFIQAASVTSQDQIKTQEYTFHFLEPQLKENTLYTTVTLEGFDSYLTDPTRPMIPIVPTTIQLPWGTTNIDIAVTCGEIRTMTANKKINPVPSLHQEKSQISCVDSVPDNSVYASAELYPTAWFSCMKGVGQTSTGDHSLFLSLHLQPIRYSPQENTIYYVTEMTIQITYQEPEYTPVSPTSTNYDLVIITPTDFSDYLHPLITHKNTHGVNTVMMTVENIYASYPGRDPAEQIKYFIKYAVETWNTRYVLLIGDITKIPIRATHAYPWNEGKDFGGNILTDMYYADLYDENYSFCSWDANNNSIFGEVQYGEGFPPAMNNTDNVDLYPDVQIGRLPCTNTDEVRLLVDKIITYEDSTYDQIWFKRIILVGGDTFPPGKGSPRNIFEGEITNTMVAQQLSGFEQIRLWSSKRNLNAITFNQAIDTGAGFLTYAGHGFEHGWGTYRSNYPFGRMGLTQPLYYTPMLRFLHNQEKLPIIFFDACLTAKLDFNISDLERYYPSMIGLLRRFTQLSYFTRTDYFPCFAWSFLVKEDGGAIATIGATRPAYTMVDENGVYAGAGYLDVHFFKAYTEGVTVGEMFTGAQTDYLNNVGKDFFTLEEFMLLGDPSLRVGGYP